MFNHIMIGSNDLERSGAFYKAVLCTLGFAGEPHKDVTKTGHTRLFFVHGGGVLCISEPINDEPATCANGATLGFKCDSPEQVQAFHDIAVAHGGTSIEDPPGRREGPMGPMDLSYVRDPDGHKLCAIHRPAAN